MDLLLLLLATLFSGGILLVSVLDVNGIANGELYIHDEELLELLELLAIWVTGPTIFKILRTSLVRGLVPGS
jgi:hypothetical protein